MKDFVQTKGETGWGCNKYLTCTEVFVLGTQMIALFLRTGSVKLEGLEDK